MRDVPTLQEAGMRGLVMNFAWNGLLAPARTPRAIVDRLQQEVSLALKTPRLRDCLLTGGFEPVGDTPDEFRKFLYAELERCAQIVRSAKIQSE
jgi:tripartite-type tricarboxylate transporter receptor subunit TctC